MKVCFSMFSNDSTCVPLYKNWANSSSCYNVIGASQLYCNQKSLSYTVNSSCYCYNFTCAYTHVNHMYSIHSHICNKSCSLLPHLYILNISTFMFNATWDLVFTGIKKKKLFFSLILYKRNLCCVLHNLFVRILADVLSSFTSNSCQVGKVQFPNFYLFH